MKFITKKRSMNSDLGNYQQSPSREKLCCQKEKVANFQVKKLYFKRGSEVKDNFMPELKIKKLQGITERLDEESTKRPIVIGEVQPVDGKLKEPKKLPLFKKLVNFNKIKRSRKMNTIIGETVMPDFVREIEKQRVNLQNTIEMDSKYDAKFNQVQKNPSKLASISFKKSDTTPRIVKKETVAPGSSAEKKRRE